MQVTYQGSVIFKDHFHLTKNEMPTAIGKIIGLIKFHFSKETSGRRTWNIMVGQICPSSPTLASPDLNHHDVETMFMYQCSKNPKWMLMDGKTCSHLCDGIFFQINPMWFEVVHFSLKKKTIFPTHKEATHPSVHLMKARGTWSSSTEEWTTLCSHLSRSVWVVLITHGLHLSTTILHRNADLQNSASTHEYAPNVCSGR